MNTISLPISELPEKLPTLIDQSLEVTIAAERVRFTTISPDVWFVHRSSKPGYRGTLAKRGQLFEYHTRSHTGRGYARQHVAAAPLSTIMELLS